MLQRRLLNALALVTIIALCLFVYWPGLGGPFMFDDPAHISRNDLVQIPDLAPDSLMQAWHSSPSPFPANRPLAQLTFGINHAFHGLNPFAYKATNLGIHLGCGLLLYLLALRVFRFLQGEEPPGEISRAQLGALFVAAFWLLNPLHLSTVLYTVQRMAQLSTLTTFAALLIYADARIDLVNRGKGMARLFLAYAVAAAGFLAKENAVLFPLLVFVMEVTLFAGRQPRVPRAASQLRLFRIFMVGLPVAAALIIFVSFYDHYGFDGRAFTREERVLTQLRVLWFYLQLLLMPDISQLGFFHDDLVTSRGITQPWTTLLALLAWSGALIAAIVLRRRQAAISFGILFYLAAHSLESSILPLEMVFEHRNYLPSLGPLFAIGWLMVMAPRTRREAGAVLTAACLVGLILAAATWVRAQHWSSLSVMTLKMAENHPGSPRANFQAAQMMISALQRPGVPNPRDLEQLAREFIARAQAARAGYVDPFFGLVVLDVSLGRHADDRVIDQLEQHLASSILDPTNFTVSQVGYLVRLSAAAPGLIEPGQMHRLFRAVLSNPTLPPTGMAGVHSAYRYYYDVVLGEPVAALEHARLAVRHWPQRWHYHRRLVEQLAKLGRLDEARTALDDAGAADVKGMRQADIRDLRRKLNQVHSSPSRTGEAPAHHGEPEQTRNQHRHTRP